MTHIDAAPCYGEALPRLAAALQKGVVRREEILIDSKICCHSENADTSAARVIADVERQLRFLGIDYFDAFFIHEPWQMEPTLAPGGALDGLLRLKNRGLVRYIGYGMGPLSYHVQALETGAVDVLLTYGHYNLLHREAEEKLLPLAAEKGVGVLNAWSIMQGLLTDRDLTERD